MRESIVELPLLLFNMMRKSVLTASILAQQWVSKSERERDGQREGERECKKEKEGEREREREREKRVT